MKKHRLGYLALVLALVLTGFAPVSRVSMAEPVRIIFMHHSTGQGVIDQGGVRAALADLGYEFWDHGYNGDGLTGPDGSSLGINWDMPGDNTDPDGWYTIFNQEVTDPPSNTFSHMLEYDVIIFKSCFPNADIQSEEQFETYRSYFLSIRDVIDQHPDKLFIALTIPPLVPDSTSPEAAVRVRRWAEYLTSAEYLDGHPNLVVFDFFNLLADESGFLRAEYRGEDPTDSHPNELANRTIGPLFVDYVDQAIRQFVPGAATAMPAQAAEATSEGEVSNPSQIGGLLVDFEGVETPDSRWDYTNDPVNQFACDVDTSAYHGEHALRMAFDIPGGGSAGCGLNFAPDPTWAAADGISFYWRADQPDLVMVFALAVADPTQPNQEGSAATPFEVELSSSAKDTWSQVTVYWPDLVKAEWFGDAGVNTFDPAQVAWMAFNVGHWEKPQVGTIWIDDIQLVKAN
jgi:hypothetical protein